MNTMMTTANAHSIPILTYHQIAEAPLPGAPFRSLYVTPERFKQQLTWLQRFGYQGLSMRDLMPYLKGEKQGKVVGITLDDGYLNNYTDAMPLLLQHGFTATCYVVSQLLGRSNEWDHAIGIRPAPLMGAQQIKGWADAGMEIGAHTRTHANLVQSSDETMQTEIRDCKHELEDILGQSVDQFCYPFGIYDIRHPPMVKNAGYAAATTTHRGRVMSGSDMLELRRIPVVRSTYWPQFLLKVLTPYENKYLKKDAHVDG